MEEEWQRVLNHWIKLIQFLDVRQRERQFKMVTLTVVDIVLNNFSHNYLLLMKLIKHSWMLLLIMLKMAWMDLMVDWRQHKMVAACLQRFLFTGDNDPNTNELLLSLADCLLKMADVLQSINRDDNQLINN